MWCKHSLTSHLNYKQHSFFLTIFHTESACIRTCRKLKILTGGCCTFQAVTKHRVRPRVDKFEMNSLGSRRTWPTPRCGRSSLSTRRAYTMALISDHHPKWWVDELLPFKMNFLLSKLSHFRDRCAMLRGPIEGLHWVRSRAKFTAASLSVRWSDIELNVGYRLRVQVF